MLTGNAPYQGKDRAAPPPTGSPAVDRLMSACLVADPAARVQRLQKVMLDLKLLLVVAARAGAPAAAGREAVAGDALRVEMAQMEARLVARLQAHERESVELIRATAEAFAQPAEDSGDVHISMLQMETRIVGRLHAVDKKVAEIQRAASEALYREPATGTVGAAELEQFEARITARLEANEKAVAGLRGQLSHVTTQLTAAQNIETSGERALATIQRSLDAITERITRLEQKALGAEHAGSGVERGRLESMEQGLEAVRKQTAELHDLMAEDMLSFEHSLKIQAGAIESARTAMAQTDDLVERVVEALESLQSTVLDYSEERPMAVN
jgi:hypothetical protein